MGHDGSKPSSLGQITEKPSFSQKLISFLSGFLYDEMGDYKIAFHVAGAPPILGALLMFFIPKVTQVQLLFCIVYQVYPKYLDGHI